MFYKLPFCISRLIYGIILLSHPTITKMRWCVCLSVCGSKKHDIQESGRIVETHCWRLDLSYLDNNMYYKVNRAQT